MYIERVSFYMNDDVLEMALDTPVILARIEGVSALDVSLNGTQIVGQVGVTNLGRSVEPREITITGKIIGDLERKRRAVITAFSPIGYGVLVVRVDGVDYEIDAAVTGTPVFDNMPRYQSFEVSLQADYPFWRTSTVQTTDFAKLAKLFRLPKNFGNPAPWKIADYSRQYSVDFENTGNADGGMVVEFTAVASVVNPQLYHIGQDRLIKLIMTLNEGDIVRVTTGSERSVMAVIDGVEQNAFRFLSPDSDINMVLTPGLNTLSYNAAANIDALRVSITAPKGVYYGI